VNGRRVAEVVLSDGDRIAIGGSELVLQEETRGGGGGVPA
jgi:pSer/pThr/pTyr-binding forkhead associated (FHA) protein